MTLGPKQRFLTATIIFNGLFFFFCFVFISQHWDVFKYVTEVFILVPALLGLKGNLEMTLASRLSTAVSIRAVEGGSRTPGVGRGGKPYTCVVAGQAKIS